MSCRGPARKCRKQLQFEWDGGIQSEKVRIAFKAFATETDGVVVHPVAATMEARDEGKLRWAPASKIKHGWTVTHQRSGLGIGTFAERDAALEFAQRLGENDRVDWTLSDDQLKRELPWSSVVAAMRRLRAEMGGW